MTVSVCTEGVFTTQVRHHTRLVCVYAVSVFLEISCCVQTLSPTPVCLTYPLNVTMPFWCVYMPVFCLFLLKIWCDTQKHDDDTYTDRVGTTLARYYTKVALCTCCVCVAHFHHTGHGNSLFGDSSTLQCVDMCCSMLQCVAAWLGWCSCCNWALQIPGLHPQTRMQTSGLHPSCWLVREGRFYGLNNNLKGFERVFWKR